jgi:hypothetical protein
MKRAIGKMVGFAPFIPISFRIGLSFLPKRLNAARDCHTSTTHQPPGIGPAMCARQPFTGQSASRFLYEFASEKAAKNWIDYEPKKWLRKQEIARRA